MKLLSVDYLAFSGAATQHIESSDSTDIHYLSTIVSQNLDFCGDIVVIVYKDQYSCHELNYHLWIL